MATYPIDPSRPAFFRQPQPAWSVLVSAGNSYSAVDCAWVGLGYVTDKGQAMPAASVGKVTALLAYSVPVDELDPDQRSPAAVITGNAEVSEAAIVYGDLDRDAVDARLCELKIIVRQAAPVVEF